MKRSDRLKDCEVTQTIDLAKLPEEYRTGNPNPYFRLDQEQLNNVGEWVERQLEPNACVDLVGKCPMMMALLLGSIMQDNGIQRLRVVSPGSGVFTIWDYTEAGE